MGHVRLFRYRLNPKAHTTVTASGATGRVRVKWQSLLVEPGPMRGRKARLLSPGRQAHSAQKIRERPACLSVACAPACVSCRAVRICEIVGRPALATRDAVLTHIPFRVRDKTALFLEHFKVRKPLSPIASSLALQPLLPLPQADPPPFCKRGT